MMIAHCVMMAMMMLMMPMVTMMGNQEMKKREKANFRIVNQLVPGTKIRAIYADEDNDPSWYDAVINSVEVWNGRQATGGEL